MAAGERAGRYDRQDGEADGCNLVHGFPPAMYRSANVERTSLAIRKRLEFMPVAKKSPGAGPGLSLGQDIDGR